MIQARAGSGLRRHRRRLGFAWTAGRGRYAERLGGEGNSLADRPADDKWDLGRVREGRNGEAIYTGTGFPRVFYLAYHLYRDYFPLLALTTYKQAMEHEAA